MNLTKLDFAILCSNLFALGGIIVLIALRGPSGPAVLLAIGAGGMSAAKIGKAICAKSTVLPRNDLDSTA
jgi:hypothetical protein